MPCSTLPSDFIQFSHCSRRILVLEPADITWLGLCRLIETSGKKEIALMRVASADSLEQYISCYAPDMLLLTSVSYRDEILPLVQRLSEITLRYPSLPVTALLKQSIPYLAELLMAFGVTTVLMQSPPLEELADILTTPAHPASKSRGVQLSLNERNVAKALLSGYSVTRLARMLGKDVRTVSAQKRSVIHKLNMSNAGELQVLGGRLMTTEQGEEYEQAV
ncbi:helix-turn-helix transcriptional regulator [Enterobacillus tribolii]|uniref:DNA-binding NarL/FixJ family response regulator n=1 Tax=Enterobacillus tribolii TaxID=1487935 RepID=A0A370QFC5_9GAMM|nr:response regulator transcription factor [Enterobacillus tribolii]MBW7984199.1 response regulator transcription factor [Enterobacillus tribolii]RDK86740.1 DNA-binding NarL/FixJ family response regulator [Enterobacillus tribolii]